MGLWTNLERPTNILLITIIIYLYVFDKEDEEERIYLKSLLFSTGCVGIINIYRYTKLGILIDEILGSEIFLDKSTKKYSEIESEIQEVESFEVIDNNS